MPADGCMGFSNVALSITRPASKTVMSASAPTLMRPLSCIAGPCDEFEADRRLPQTAAGDVHDVKRGAGRGGICDDFLHGFETAVGFDISHGSDMCEHRHRAPGCQCKHLQDFFAPCARRVLDDRADPQRALVHTLLEVGQHVACLSVGRGIQALTLFRSRTLPLAAVNERGHEPERRIGPGGHQCPVLFFV